MASQQTLSFELLHLYLGDPSIERAAFNGLSHASKWAEAVSGVFTKTKIVNVVFIDDYSGSKEEKPKRDSVENAVLAAAERVGLTIDYIVYESDVARTAHFLRTHLVRQPEKGEASFLPPRHSRQYDDLNGRFDFEYVSDDFDPDTESARERGIDIRSHEFRNDIGIGVRIGRRVAGTDETVWSCPTLAAWWQLIRLGVLKELGEPNIDGAPEGSWARKHENRPTFDCDKTLTLLSQSYIEIEHPVRVILRNLGSPYPFGTTRALKDGRAWYERLSYIFND